MDRLMYYFSSTEGDDAWTAMTTHMGIEPPFVEQTSRTFRSSSGPCTNSEAGWLFPPAEFRRHS